METKNAFGRGHRSGSYLNYICVLFFLAYGMISLDASSVSYISDVIMSELGITVAQYSVLSSSIWATKAFASIAIGILADRTGKRKLFLGPLLIFAGILSILTSFSTSFWFILVCRFLCGCCIGAGLSMMVSIIRKNLKKNDFGARSGFVSCGSAVLSSTLGPIILTAIVLHFSWRGAFRFTGSVMLLLGLAIQFTVSEVEYPILNKDGGLRGFMQSMGKLFSNKAFLICLLIGVLETAGKMSITIFGPVYLTEVYGASTQLKGNILSAMGLVYIPVSYIVPMLADKFKSNRVMMLTFVLCMVTPVSMALFSGSTLSVIALIIFGNWAAATVSIFIYVIPGKVLPQELTGTANGVIMGVSVFFGGFICPIIFGSFADGAEGLRLMSYICTALFAICAILSGLVGKGLKGESNES